MAKHRGAAKEEDFDMPKITTPKKTAARPRFPDAPSRQPSILIVDSDAPLRMALSGYLQDCGFKVFESASAEETIDILQHSAVAIDLVLADVALPGRMDGFELSTWIRANKSDVQILLAASDASKARRAQELCESEPFFAKPYDVKNIVRALRAAIQKRERR
jgi:CheY-like chemotaxis protein